MVPFNRTRGPAPCTRSAGVTDVTKLLCSWPEGLKSTLVVYVSRAAIEGVKIQFWAIAGCAANAPIKPTASTDLDARAHISRRFEGASNRNSSSAR